MAVYINWLDLGRENDIYNNGSTIVHTEHQSPYKWMLATERGGFIKKTYTDRSLVPHRARRRLQTHTDRERETISNPIRSGLMLLLRVLLFFFFNQFLYKHT